MWLEPPLLCLAAWVLFPVAMRFAPLPRKALPTSTESQPQSHPPSLNLDLNLTANLNLGPSASSQSAHILCKRVKRQRDCCRCASFSKVQKHWNVTAANNTHGGVVYYRGLASPRFVFPESFPWPLPSLATHTCTHLHTPSELLIMRRHYACAGPCAVRSSTPAVAEIELSSHTPATAHQKSYPICEEVWLLGDAS